MSESNRPYYPVPDGVSLRIVPMTAEDGVSLGGLYFTSPGTPDIGVVAVHGIQGEFYAGVPGFVSPALAKSGYRCLSINLRNHGPRYSESIFEDCEKDIGAAVELLEHEGCRKVVLVGHSLGCTEIVYYQAKRRDNRIGAIILAGAHSDLRGSSWQFFSSIDPDNPRRAFNDLLTKCRALVAEGKGDTLVIMPHSLPHAELSIPQKFISVTAKTFLSYRAPESNCSILKWADRITVPMLLPVHEVVTTFAKPEFSYEIKEAAVGCPRCDVVMVRGAGHYYTGHEDEVSAIIVDWLKKVLPAP